MQNNVIFGNNITLNKPVYSLLIFNDMKKTISFLIFYLSVFYSFSQPYFSMEEVVRYLASPELEGRRVQTKGDTLTIQYLVNQFEMMDVKPFFDQFEQPLCGRSIFTATQGEICSKNVVALVEGTDPKLKNQYILICAHFDHLGKAKGVYFPGANDNASGTAMVLRLADYFAKNPTKRSIIFACFAGEEIGFLGSSSFVKKFPESLTHIKYVINFDMVGRYDHGGLSVMGEQTSKILEKTVQKISKQERINMLPSTFQFFTGSDHYVFYQKNIPFLCFNTGDDKGNYHRPQDRADSIDFRGMERIATFAKQVIAELANSDKEPKFKKIEQGKPTIDRETMKQMLLTNPNKFGFTYNFAEECGNEIVIHKTTKAGDEAGLLVGDRVIKINGKGFTCSMDFFELARTEKVRPFKITIIRDSVEMVIEVN
jgi:hypothetical protein